MTNSRTFCPAANSIVALVGVVENPLMRGSAAGALPLMENIAASVKFKVRVVPLCLAVYLGADGHAKTMRV